MFRSVRTLVVVAVALALVGSCGSPDRPAAGEWAARWYAMVSSMPALDALDLEDPSPLCDLALTRVREERQLLVPTPDPAFDAPVEGWMDLADETFFECPPRSGDVHGFEEALAEMALLEAQVDASLAASP
jgi:hypothetical protein